jgi:hypothetical protein
MLAPGSAHLPTEHTVMTAETRKARMVPAWQATRALGQSVFSDDEMILDLGNWDSERKPVLPELAVTF